MSVLSFVPVCNSARTEPLSVRIQNPSGRKIERSEPNDQRLSLRQLGPTVRAVSAGAAAPPPSHPCVRLHGSHYVA